jgi:hypothetical protein
MLIDFNVAEKTKTLTDGAGCAEFADGESHRTFSLRSGRRPESRTELYPCEEHAN